MDVYAECEWLCVFRQRCNSDVVIWEGLRLVMINEPAANDLTAEKFVRAVIQARLDRQIQFPEELFSDPAWDILLGAYAAELGQLPLTLTGACIASNVPATSAYRWISTLEHHNLIERHPNAVVNRSSFVALTERASSAMKSYFAGVNAMPL